MLWAEGRGAEAELGAKMRQMESSALLTAMRIKLGMNLFYPQCCCYSVSLNPQQTCSGLGAPSQSYNIPGKDGPYETSKWASQEREWYWVLSLRSNDDHLQVEGEIWDLFPQKKYWTPAHYAMATVCVVPWQALAPLFQVSCRYVRSSSGDSE